MTWNDTERSFGCRFFLTYSGGEPTAAELDTFATDIQDVWVTNLRALTTSDYSLVEVESQDLSSSSGSTGLWSGSVAGTRSDVNIPASCVAGIDFGILRRYRGGKPKIFLPCGVQGDLQNAGTWNSTFLTAMASGWASFIAGVLAISGTGVTPVAHVNVSWYSGFTNVTNPVTGRTRAIARLRGTPQVDPIVSYLVRPRIGSQRRRTRV